MVDPGLQNERTELAWQRTALSLLTGSLILFRLTVETVSTPAVCLLLITVPVTCWVLARSRVRYHGHRVAETPPSDRDGSAAAGLTAVLVAMSLTELLSLAAR